MTIIEHAIAGANQGSWTTTADASGNVTDMTYAIFDGNGSQLTLTTYELIDGQLHSDSAARSTMGRKTLQTAVMFDNYGGPDSSFVGFGMPYSSAQIPEGVASGWPMILDNTATGEELVAIEGLYCLTTGGTGVEEVYLSINADRSSSVADNTTIEDPFPFVLTLTSDYDTGASIAIGAAASEFDAKAQATIPSPETVQFNLAAPSSYYLADILPLKLSGRANFDASGNTITASPASTYGDLDTMVSAGQRIFAMDSVNDRNGGTVHVVSSVSGDVITVGALATSGTTEVFFVFDGYYIGTHTGGTTTQTLTDSTRTAGGAGVAWNTAAFVALTDSGNWVVHNLTTGMIQKIQKGASASNTDDDLNIYDSALTILHPGIRSGAINNEWQTNDVYCIMPQVTLTATYTDPGASSGGSVGADANSLNEREITYYQSLGLTGNNYNELRRQFSDSEL